MNDRKLRVVVLTQGGCELAIRRLAALECAEIAGIFVETDIVRRRGLREKIARSVRYDGYVGTAAKLARKMVGAGGAYDSDINAIRNSLDGLRAIAEARGIPLHFVANYNTEDAMALMRAADADLGVVLGTNILKEAVFKIPRLGSINLHQGLAPYYRGGPSVFWELFNGERGVGLTVHYVASKVDTGDIVLQRTVPLEYDYTYRLDYEAFIEDYRKQLQLPCADLIAQAVGVIAEGTASPRPQEPGLGKRYRLPIKKEKDELRRRLRERRRIEATCSLGDRVSSTGD